MSTAIVRHDATLSSLADVRVVAEQFAISSYFDAKGNSPTAIAQILTKIMAGRELGYGPFASVNGIHVIQGKPSVSANMMAAAVKASGRYDYRVRKMDDEGVAVEFFEVVGGKRESLGVSSFTKKDADKAGTQNMNKFPRNMMFARAMSNGVKWFCPDVFNGSAVYVPEELGAEVDSDGNVIDVQPRVIEQEAQPQSTPPAVTVTTTGNGAAGNGGNGRKGDALSKAFHASGARLYGQDWDAKRHEIVRAYTKGRTESSRELTPDELRFLTARMDAKLQEQLGTITVESAPELNPDALTVPA